MQTDADGLRILEVREGCVLYAYRDSVGVWTIGVGHTGPDVYPGLVWTQAQADAAFRTNVKEREDSINRSVTVQLKQNQYNALVSFIFNVGVGGFERSTLLKKLNAGDFIGAANQFDEWHIPTSIIGRRNDEKRQFLGDVTATITPRATTFDVQRKIGLPADQIDGFFGPLTKAAVIRFQIAHGLEPDGIVGPRTLEAMGF